MKKFENWDSWKTITPKGGDLEKFPSFQSFSEAAFFSFLFLYFLFSVNEKSQRFFRKRRKRPRLESIHGKGISNRLWCFVSLLFMGLYNLYIHKCPTDFWTGNPSKEPFKLNPSQSCHLGCDCSFAQNVPSKLCRGLKERYKWQHEMVCAVCQSDPPGRF